MHHNVSSSVFLLSQRVLVSVMDFGHEGHQNYHLDIEETRWRYEESSPPVPNVLGGLAAGAIFIRSPNSQPSRSSTICASEHFRRVDIQSACPCQVSTLKVVRAIRSLVDGFQLGKHLNKTNLSFSAGLTREKRFDLRAAFEMQFAP